MAQCREAAATHRARAPHAVGLPLADNKTCMSEAGSAAPQRTFAAVLPHPQVHSGDVLAAAVAVRELGHPEHVRRHAGDVVGVVAEDPGQGRLLELRQLRGGEHPGVFVPQPARRDGEVRGRQGCPDPGGTELSLQHRELAMSSN